jgi:hypothetical protein
MTSRGKPKSGSIPDKPDPKYWRERAKNTRADAERMADHRAKHLLLAVAESYERLAERIAVRLHIKTRNEVGGQCRWAGNCRGRLGDHYLALIEDVAHAAEERALAGKPHGGERGSWKAHGWTSKARRKRPGVIRCPTSLSAIRTIGLTALGSRASSRTRQGTRKPNAC